MPDSSVAPRAIAALTLAAAFLATAAAVAAQPPAAAAVPTLAEARARLQQGDPAGAATLLERITAAHPDDRAAWTLLGTAFRQAKQPAEAIAAYTKTLALDPDQPQVFFHLGAAHAAQGEAAAALTWLERARRSRRVDMTAVAADPAFASLRTDPRIRRLMPTDDDFAAPFVEPVTVLREWRGESANDQFGWIARSLGDVDGDGVADVVTSAPTRSAGAAKAGRIYVYSTGSGSLLWTADGAENDQLGIGVESAGDVDGDGINDVIASAPGGGYARIYAGRSGKALLTLKAEAAGDAFGRHVASVGDVDGDGHADVIVGAPQNDAAGEDAGRAYVYSGKDGARLLTLNGERPGDGFGSAVAGHTSGGQTLILVGAPNAGPNKTGRTYVYDGLTDRARFVIEADDTGAALGAMFLSVPGDVDGDGHADVYASDFSNAARGPATGRVVVHSGRTGAPLLTLTGETAGEGFGTSPSVAGDVDGDGHADLIVGAWQYGGAAVSGGRAYLYSGADGRLLRTFTCRIPGDTFGFDAVDLGDVDADGMVDLLITSAWSGIRGYHSGRVFVLSSGIRKAATAGRDDQR
jgi:Tetratricopeptide repeat/FG-GAP repeat/FG-GAP-like repeat